MKFSVLTASYNQLSWLKRCVRSVADQKVDAGIEHIVQDAGTGPELEEWLRDNSTVNVFVEKDRGIYDALNRGLRRAGGDVVAFLQCDEQYLPGALARVEQAFRAHPQADIVVGDHLLINTAGRLLGFRKSTKLRPLMILTDHLYDYTCAMFFHRRLLERGIFFDPEYRAAGDADWVVRLLRSGARAVYLREYLAAFTVTGGNASLRANPAEEIARLRRITPRWALMAAPLLRQIRHLEKLFAGGYWSPAIVYEIYGGESDTRRTRFVCDKPSFRHPWDK